MFRRCAFFESDLGYMLAEGFYREGLEVGTDVVHRHSVGLGDRSHESLCERNLEMIIVQETVNVEA